MQIEAPPQPSTLHFLRSRPWQIEAPPQPSTLHTLRPRPWAQMEAPPQPSTLHTLRTRPWAQIEAPPQPSTLHLLGWRPCTHLWRSFGISRGRSALSQCLATSPRPRCGGCGVNRLISQCRAQKSSGAMSLLDAHGRLDSQPAGREGDGKEANRLRSKRGSSLPIPMKTAPRWALAASPLAQGLSPEPCAHSAYPSGGLPALTLWWSDAAI